MFKKRLTWFWILLTVVALVIIGRLVQIQVADAAQYDELAERILTRRPIYIPAPRGTIHDRHGTPLLSDEPTFDVGLRYALVSADEPFLDNYLIKAARDLRKRGDYLPNVKLLDIVAELKQIDIPYMWQRLSALTGVSAEHLAERADALRRRVQRILANVQRSSPSVRPTGSGVPQRSSI